MASKAVQRSHTEKQALKQHTKKAERQQPKTEGRRRDFVNEIEFNNAATGGHSDDPIPTRPNSRSAVADQRRAAEKGVGVMSVSTKIDPEVKVAGVRDPRGRTPAPGSDKDLDQSSVRADATPERRAKSNAEIAEGVTTTARRSPAPRAARTVGGAGVLESRTMTKRTGGPRQRVPAPGNVVSLPKGEFIPGRNKATAENEYVTSSTGGRKPPKRPARAGKGMGASRAKGADAGLDD